MNGGYPRTIFAAGSVAGYGKKDIVFYELYLFDIV